MSANTGRRKSSTVVTGTPFQKQMAHTIPKSIQGWEMVPALSPQPTFPTVPQVPSRSAARFYPTDVETPTWTPNSGSSSKRRDRTQACTPITKTPISTPKPLKEFT
ncbi:hypothetical protein QAD02_021691 [Eretmocerus hayati]|uniref:Uncharacterized protein n=1 Tax=Eretmocerus hayati TaxID=131215 RepID=A0ACC2PQY7_9HYME|nr:hypothetical protein QAD02_021691 [Eretmocerus hayati]